MGSPQLKLRTMAHDPYSGIDFDEINEATGLAPDEIKCLKTCFDLFDTKKVEFLSADDLGEIRFFCFRVVDHDHDRLLSELGEGPFLPLVLAVFLGLAFFQTVLLDNRNRTQKWDESPC